MILNQTQDRVISSVLRAANGQCLMGGIMRIAKKDKLVVENLVRRGVLKRRGYAVYLTHNVGLDTFASGQRKLAPLKERTSS